MQSLHVLGLLGSRKFFYVKKKFVPNRILIFRENDPGVPGALKAWARGEPMAPGAPGASRGPGPWAAHNSSEWVYHNIACTKRPGPLCARDVILYKLRSFISEVCNNDVNVTDSQAYI